ncbi:MAG: ribonuclease Y [Patescibacteria group bacterium]|nr:ribonuclease Y [Patescibacteria group bacterium]
MGLLDIIANALIEEGKSEDGKVQRTSTSVNQDKTQVKSKKPVKKEVKAGSSESKEALAHKIASELAEIERKEGALGERERQIEASTREVKVLKEKAEEKLKSIEELRKKQLAKLEKIAELDHKEARDILLEATEKRISAELAKKIEEAKEEIRESVEEEAKELLIDSMQHGATDYTAEYTISSVKLEDEGIKGRIIGREGRNIRAFEKATGVEIELDEANEIILSSFDSIRREVAKRALLKLIKDRRITPARIEEVVNQTRNEVDKITFEEGKKLCHSVGVYRLHPDLMKLLGKFKFRFSYGQNMIIHTLEETRVGVQVAHEVGANVNVVRLGCLLHDIGKVITDGEGTHVQLGVDVAKKYGLPKEVIDTIAEHHEDIPFSSPESRVVWISDAVSGSRPGARYEPHEDYLKRMTQIEEIASEFPGVKEVFAYQAGRDVRVLVKPEEVSDDELIVLASKIASELEKKVSYAGQIKVTCIRETSSFDTTKAK